MRKKLEFVWNTLVWLCLLLYSITGIFLHVGLDEDLYYKLQMRENVPVTAGISEADLMHLDYKLSLHLLGVGSLDAADDESLMISVNGVMQPAFNEREIQHMQDCQRLFRKLSIAHDIFEWLVMAFILINLLLYWSGSKKYENHAEFWLGSGIILVPLGIFALWALIDFSSAFTFFHKLLFTNDLWLLDPRTDLLINICPQSMFMSMGLRIALPSFGLLLGVPLLATALDRFSKKRKRKQNEVSDL